jgi:hypothetical protein
MKRTTILYLFILFALSVFAGCEEMNNYSTNPNLRLRFSVDTLSFDTVFSTIGSTTKQFLVYNPNDEALRIEKILLANAGVSGFRINVDGRKGTAFQNIDIWRRDSLYVSVEVTVDPNGTLRPLVIEDSILFYTNGIRQSVLLQACGQDIHLIKGGVTYTKDTTLTADLPYVIYDSLVVPEGVTLTLDKGVTLYMHNKASLIISGTLKAKGTQDEPVVIRGDRLDYIYADVVLPYDRTPGQWGGIYFSASSFDNEFDHVMVRNGSSGLMFWASEPERTKISIRHSQITNMDANLLIAINCRIEVSDTELSNAAGAVVALIGGKYQFTHCTIANYNRGLGNSRDGNPALILSNKMEIDQKESLYPLQQAFFDNCIIDGNAAVDTTKLYGGEIRLFSNEEKEQGNDETFHYRFNACYLKTARVNNERFINNLFGKSPTYLKNGTKEEIFEYDFRLANESVGIGKADRTIAEQYPVDRYGVDRLTGGTAPSVGAYEYVYQEEKKSK